MRGRERILHLCSSTKQKPPPPQGWHILRFSLQHGVWVNKTGRRRNVDHCTGGSISSSLHPVPSRVRAIYKEGERESHWNISLYSRPQERAAGGTANTASSYHYTVGQHLAASTSLWARLDWNTLSLVRLKPCSFTVPPSSPYSLASDNVWHGAC